MIAKTLIGFTSATIAAWALNTSTSCGAGSVAASDSADDELASRALE